MIVGDGGVGKSSLIRRYCQGVFTSSYKKTIGVDFLEKVVTADTGAPVRLMLWDTAGQEEFDAITRAYYRGAQACVVAFSTTDRDSLLAVRKWRKKVEDECGDIPMVLVQNKIDLISKAEISSYETERMASDNGMRLYRTSVKEDLNVDLVFQHLAENYIKKVRSTDSIDSGFHSLKIGVGVPGPMTRSLISNHKHLAQQCEMVRYRGGGAPRKQGAGRRLRSRSQDRHRRHKCSDPVISDYLASPMFDSLHTRQGVTRPGGGMSLSSVSLLSRSSSRHSQPFSVISQCKVL